MFDDSRSFINRAFLQSRYDFEYQAWIADGRDAGLLERLQSWSSRSSQSETQDESTFIQTFFVELWGYEATGRSAAPDYSMLPKYPVPGAGAGGGAGAADMGLGWFRAKTDTAQVLCEFKDIRTGLEARQNRKGSSNSPVEQCLNYVRQSRKGLFGNEPVQPWWGLVTDMNEFRLYWWDRAPREFVKFTIRSPRGSQADLFAGHDLLSDSEDARFDRFLFAKLFSRDLLIARSGRPALWRLVEQQWVRERKIEEEFYEHYKAVRERLFAVLRITNPGFPGTPTQLLRVTQKLLDRFIFAFYCEDMGERMLFPPQFLRERLRKVSIDDFYEESGAELWDFFKRLFRYMDSGGQFGSTQVPQINGGLFARDELIDGLEIPNHVFAKAGQGANDASLEQDTATLFYLSARYNYAAKGDARDSLSLYTLGRIFEQSITELEYRIGEIEQRPTVAKLSKRKRDGVYYTPEWVVNYLVEETLSPWFAKAREDAGSAAAYLERLRAIRIIDPACGSGAFLISAFRRLLDERKKLARELDPGMMAIDEAPIIAEILASNLYGVDLNPSSVEIAKLALWLHSARANSPLSSLNETIRCGNSLVRDDIWQMVERTDELEERINPFPWDRAFAEGFDIVLGNPPYVKLQNMVPVYPEAVAYLQATRPDGTYQSAQTGNFDLYLPFIEQGLRLLRPGGRMAYIAPSLWAVNQYGEGLRRLLHRTRQLERWIDFKSYQVFNEAITYTALQFFTAEPNEDLRVVTSPQGEVGDIDWREEELAVPVDELAPDAEWLMATGEEREVILALAARCLRLDDPAATEAISVGIQTSADKIYHLQRLGRDRYLCSPKDEPAYEVQIEDGIMRPLVSGAEAKRYEAPQTETFVLFPYEMQSGSVRQIPATDFASRFPHAYAHLRRYERDLRGRESAAFDDDAWYRFGRNQGLDKQVLRKLIVAQTVPEMRVCADYEGAFYLNNVRVNGILPAAGCDMSFLIGCLNSPVADFVFRRIAKPKQGGWFEANKQFIAPLPIPRADAGQQREVGLRAQDLQERWTHRRDLLAEAGERLAVLARAKHGARWLWPELPSVDSLKEQAPRRMAASDKTKWAKAEFERLEEQQAAALSAYLQLGELRADFTDGELRLFARGTVALKGIFLDEEAGMLARAYWQFLIFSGPGTDGLAFAKKLRLPPAAADSAAARQFLGKVADLEAEIAAIRGKEGELNEILYGLYGLSDEERIVIERDCAKRPVI